MYRIRLYIVPERPEVDDDDDEEEEGVDVGDSSGSGTSLGGDEDDDAGFWSSGDSERGRRHAKLDAKRHQDGANDSSPPAGASAASPRRPPLGGLLHGLRRDRSDEVRQRGPARTPRDLSTDSPRRHRIAFRHLVFALRFPPFSDSVDVFIS